ncbi:MAG: helicase-related protein [Isosphaeraceae bacterium]
MSFSAGMTVRCRGQRCVVLDAHPVAGGAPPAYRLRVRATEGPLRNREWPVLYPLERVEPDELPPLSLEQVGRDARFRLLHEAFLLTLAPPPSALVAAGRSRIRFELYQQVPALRMLALPRPRILNASDVGLGKTIETGIALRELIARRRGGRILIVCPSGIADQWRDEMDAKFGLHFKVFDREGVHEVRKSIDLGANPWATEPRIIASFDYLKRREGAFREVQNLRYNVIVCDEVHHLADNTSGDDISDRHRLAQWIARASDALILLSATPHSGYDESFASLLNLIEPTLVTNSKEMSFKQYGRYLVRHLKRHIKKPDGSPLFVPADASKPIAVTLTPAEANVHAAVAKQAATLDKQAEKLQAERDRYALRLVATILRKRAASSLSALRETVANRLENLEHEAEEVELRRDHLRSLRKGETISDEDLKQLERDAHRSYLARIRSVGKVLRAIETEMEDLLDLQSLLGKCPDDTESKAEALLAELRAIHHDEPDEKVIVFSEYSATVFWLASFLGRHGYADHLLTFDGSLSGPERQQTLARFQSPDTLLLISTDAASEGLNLQERCRRVIHYELPFNPNRMLQRQGRVDRYGQERPCRFAFLYAKDTYEGEVLSRLFTKIEAQITRLGAIGDVLGALQTDRIEQLLSRSPDDLKAAIAAAERSIDEELSRVDDTHTKAVLGDDALTSGEVEHLQTALAAGRRLNVSIGDFVVRAIGLAGGRCRRQDGRIVVAEVPVSWVGGRVLASYDTLFNEPDVAPSVTPSSSILDDDHPLAQAAIRWVRGSRYDPRDDHRLAVRVLDTIDGPDLVASYIVTLRAGDNTEMERLMAVRVRPDGTVDPNDPADQIPGQGIADLPGSRVHEIFGTWWESANRVADEEVKRRAENWMNEIRGQRLAEHSGLRDRFKVWADATRKAILGEYDDPTTFLPGIERHLPPTVKRRLREHRREIDEHESFLNRRVRFEPAAVESLGVLLRAPAKESRT